MFSIAGIDLLEQELLNHERTLLEILLQDKTTKKNIIWATDDYAELGEPYSFKKEILPELVTGEQDSLIQPRVEKALEHQTNRTRDKAEVFTPSWICNAQNNLVDEQWFGRKDVFNIQKEMSWKATADKIAFPDDCQHTWQKYVDAQRLEISCGEAPYLVSRYDTVTGETIPISQRIGLLDRKLRVISENTDTEEEWFTWTKRAFQSVYGFEYQGDSLLLARENLFVTFVEVYRERFGKLPHLRQMKVIANIIAWNLWQMDGTKYVVPGVKEASALSKLLKEHPVFGAYKVANVAGDGDAEMPYDNALTLVKQVIKANRYTITISCGKLTTGVTVPEWTAVMMLTGAASTAAPGYMQTIFRVQSAGVLDGKQKERCYVFDFAPDRALNVLSEVNCVTKRGKTNEEEYRKALGEFLNFCPVIAVDGTQMTEYSVPKMMRQIKRLTVDKAIKSGFDDESVYKQDTGMVMDEEDVQLFHTLSDKLSEQKAAKKETKVHINHQGLTGEEYEKADKISNKPKRERTKEDDDLLKKLQEQKKEREKVIRLLRNVSIRLPLLIYGAKVDLTESIKMADFITLVDEESWQEFMPKTVDKPLFRKLLKYYDEDVVSGAGLRIRRMAKAADELPPTERVKRIAEIFSHFRNPDKETVLTPWRVVNLHLSSMVGGYCFLNEQFDPQEVLEEPRLVDQGQVTEDIFLNPEARILEMNSKSGLYPLYMAYSLYAMKLPGPEDKLPLEQTQALWQETVEQQIFVLCKTRMAESITRRTLVGYQDWTVNTTYIPHLLERMEKDPQRLAKKLQRTDTWGKEGQPMKFDAIVGNPPYQEDTGGGSAANVAAKQARPVYNLFVDQAKTMQPHYISMIMPARWYAGGIGLNDFRNEMLNDPHLIRLTDFVNSKDCFSTVDIAGGICYFLWDRDKEEVCEVTNVSGLEHHTMRRNLNEFGEIFIRSNESLSIIHKVLNRSEHFLTDRVQPIDAFGFPSAARGEKEPFDGCISLIHSQGTGYIKRSDVKKNAELIDKYKATISILVPCNGEVGIDPSKGYKAITTPRIEVPGEVNTFSYLVLGAFDTEAEIKNYKQYLMCKFTRFMLRLTYSSMHIARANFIFVPDQDFTEEWTDEKLYRKYELTEDEIAFIESTIRVME